MRDILIRGCEGSICSEAASQKNHIFSCGTVVNPRPEGENDGRIHIVDIQHIGTELPSQQFRDLRGEAGRYNTSVQQTAWPVFRGCHIRKPHVSKLRRYVPFAMLGLAAYLLDDQKVQLRSIIRAGCSNRHSLAYSIVQQCYFHVPQSISSSFHPCHRNRPHQRARTSSPSSVSVGQPRAVEVPPVRD
jgi:hypothetical protein